MKIILQDSGTPESDLFDTLIAISVVSKRLAVKILKEMEEEQDGKDE